MSQPPLEPYPAAFHLPPPRPSHPIDITISIIEIVLMALGSAVVTFYIFVIGVFIGAGGDCGSGRSCDDTDGFAFVVGLLSPWVLTVLALVFCIVQFARKRLAFWIPLVTVVLWALLQFGLLQLLSR